MERNLPSGGDVRSQNQQSASSSAAFTQSGPQQSGSNPHIPVPPRDNDEITDIIFGYDRSFTHGFSEGFNKATNEESTNSRKLGTIHGHKIGLDVGVMRGVAKTLLALENPSLSLSANTENLKSISKLSANCFSLLDLCNEIESTNYLPDDPLFEILDKARKKYRMICAQSKIAPNVGPELSSPVSATTDTVDVQNSF
ncbi:uncharacterized protein LOC142335268 [Convolutriloba macropyga]|uniref:uncharacterized protein LOC142335268 n=1 Tax=Convolutriloba macropyga TaxID=536237 RepID=UPI003F525B11